MTIQQWPKKRLNRPGPRSERRRNKGAQKKIPANVNECFERSTQKSTGLEQPYEPDWSAQVFLSNISIPTSLAICPSTVEEPLTQEMIAIWLSFQSSQGWRTIRRMRCLVVGCEPRQGSQESVSVQRNRHQVISSGRCLVNRYSVEEPKYLPAPRRKRRAPSRLSIPCQSRFQMQHTPKLAWPSCKLPAYRRLSHSEVMGRTITPSLELRLGLQ